MKSGHLTFQVLAIVSLVQFAYSFGEPIPSYNPASYEDVIVNDANLPPYIPYKLFPDIELLQRFIFLFYFYNFLLNFVLTFSVTYNKNFVMKSGNSYLHGTKMNTFELRSS